MIPELIFPILVFLIRTYKYLQMHFLNAFFLARCKQFWSDNLNKLDIQVNGDRSWDIKIHDDAVYTRALDCLGMGETYMEGLWDCDDIPGLFSRVLQRKSTIMTTICQNPIYRFLNYVETSLMNLQSKERARKDIKLHYDLGNDLFQAMLDPSMTYSCGYWKTAQDLQEAQFDKMELIAKKLFLRPGMHVLEIGCGWGGLAYHLAKYYGVAVTGITISEEQAIYARKKCDQLPVQIDLVDYRDVTGDSNYDRVVSIECLEHIGLQNYDVFFIKVHQLLKEEGIFLLQTGGINHHGIPRAGPWINKYIFPGSSMPYYKDIADVIEKRFIIEDWQNFGHDYCATLKAWGMNFNKNWDQLEPRYGAKFGRMWTYYLEICNGLFKSRVIQVWQIVLSKEGIKGGFYAGR